LHEVLLNRLFGKLVNHKFCFLFVLILCQARAGSSPAVPNNAEQLDLLVLRAIAQIPACSSAEEHDFIISRTPRGDGVERMVDQRLSEWALAAGSKTVRIVEPGKSGDANAIQLRYSVLAVGSDYTPIYRPDSLRRTVSMTIQFTLLNPDQEIAWAKTISDSLLDSIDADALKQLEECDLPATVGIGPKKTQKWKWLEPALVTAVSAMVVYLFYSYRSN